MATPKKPVNPLRETPSTHLRSLLDKAEYHRTLEDTIKALLPGALAEKCRFGGIKNGELSLIVPSSAVASQVRFQQRAILPQLRRDPRLHAIWRIRVRVSPPPFRKPAAKPIRGLSKENARLLEEEAGHTEDQNLKEVLLKLAKHLQ